VWKGRGISRWDLVKESPEAGRQEAFRRPENQGAYLGQGREESPWIFDLLRFRRGKMEVIHFSDCDAVAVEQFPFKGTMRKVVGTSVRWLSRAGDDGHGNAEYGLRHFTVEPGGEIPIHNHFYHQTMYILTGRFECWRFDGETEKLLEKREVGPGDSVYIPSLEAHGMRNVGTEPATFLCCIANVYEGQE